MRILLVEDDRGVARASADALRARGHAPMVAGTVGAALELVGDAELVLLDLSLPDGDGLSLLRRIRRDSTIPVIVLTARGTERDVVRGLHLGADDYLVKPVRLRELVARVDAVARRVVREDEPASTVTVGDLTVDLEARRVRVGDQVVDLTPTEFAVLEVLSRRRGLAVSREQILDVVWGDAPRSASKSLDVHLSSLRSKLDRPGLLTTVRGFGYRFGE